MKDEQFSPEFVISFAIKEIKWKKNNWSFLWYVIELN